jgi:3-hydroxymyristoyl/3-hydroxydecanoyl-(acyl carrier protein) dehydratase
MFPVHPFMPHVAVSEECWSVGRYVCTFVCMYACTCECMYVHERTRTDKIDRPLVLSADN